MYYPHETKKMLEKLERCLTIFEPYVFEKIDSVPFLMFETNQHFRTVPENSNFKKAKKFWGHEGGTCWFKLNYKPPTQYEGHKLYVMPCVGGYEALLWVNNMPIGTFATKIVVTRHGNHYCNLFCESANPQLNYEIAIEFYAGHKVIGCQPFEVTETANSDFIFEASEISICKKRQNVADFIYDLRILIQLANMLDKNSFRYASVIDALEAVHKILRYDPENIDLHIWEHSLQLARDAMKPCLLCENGHSAPQAVLTGHSHMDTAWLWPVKETIRKNARTISNQISLMQQFPEYRFIQSASLHTRMIQNEYPQIFKAMKEQIEKGRYEINGAVWVECDCNLTGGEALVRQFLWGQRYTLETFGILSDCFWLPDTFGYSAALPQIMKGFGVKYFLTTKLAWNDTNTFPWETFQWEGLDKTKVLSHFFVMDTWPDPKGLIERLDGIDYKDCIHNKTVTKQRLIAFGFGDGGGGPQFEMIEIARRMQNLEGCPKVRYSSVSQFMQEIEQFAHDKPLPTYKGELYLELHRGTLTAQQKIKKNNRVSENMLHCLEALNVIHAINNGIPADSSLIHPLWEILLQNQFHDILPGSCIACAHDESIAETNQLISTATTQIKEYIGEFNKLSPNNTSVNIWNLLGVHRNDVVYIPVKAGYTAKETLSRQSQMVLMPNGEWCVAVAEIPQIPFSCTCLQFSLAHNKPQEIVYNDIFSYKDNLIKTPYYSITLDENGAISSCIDNDNKRQLCGENGMNVFYTAEDVSASWDGWDIDADCLPKLAASGKLLTQNVVSCGNVELRIRSKYSIGRKSSIFQDMILYACSPLITFATELDWQEKHCYLQVAFDTTINSPFARHEIQFGNIQRPTTRNNSYEQAMFEVCNHKYTDLSEPSYGIAVLNDCKYGVAVHNGRMSLSIAKGGMRPDPRGDCGTHTFQYALLPHNQGYSAQSVVHPAYCFNIQSYIGTKHSLSKNTSLISISAKNVIIETLKPCEDTQKAIIVRIYECEGTATYATIFAQPNCYRMVVCNMLEQELYELKDNFFINSFQILTIKIFYN